MCLKTTRIIHKTFGKIFNNSWTFRTCASRYCWLKGWQKKQNIAIQISISVKPLGEHQVIILISNSLDLCRRMLITEETILSDTGKKIQKCVWSGVFLIWTTLWLKLYGMVLNRQVMLKYMWHTLWPNLKNNSAKLNGSIFFHCDVKYALSTTTTKVATTYQ